MRILYCNKYNFRFSGTESYLFDTMALMRQRGHETALFSVADSRGEPTPYDKYFVPRAGVSATSTLIEKAKFAAGAVYSPLARRKLRDLIEDFCPEVAHVRNIYHHLSPSILWELKAQGIPVLYHVNDMKLLCPTYNMVDASGLPCEKCKGGAFRHVVTEGCYKAGRAAATVLALEAYTHRWLQTYERCVDLLLVPSEFVKQKFIESGWTGAKIEVLPHFQNLPASAISMPYPTAPILYFGRLSHEKGVADLIAAMALVPDLELIVAGEGPQRAELQALASGLRLANVTFAGQLTGTELNELIAGSHFTVFPSRAYETFGKSILESYAHGRAVIASDLGSRRELVHEGRTGVLYPPGNVKALAAAIRLLHSNPEVARAMGEAGRKLVASHYSAERHLHRLCGIYEQLAALSCNGTRHLRAREKQGCRSDERGTAPGLSIAYIGGRGVVGKYSGIETYYEETGTRLASMGHDVTVYCRTHFTPDIDTHRGMRVVRLPSIRSKHLETLTHTLLSTLHASFSSCDVVHYHTLGPALFAFVPRMFGKKTIVTVQGLDWQRKKWAWFAQLVLKTGEWAAARLPNKTIVVSRTLQRRLRFRHHCEADYVPNGAALNSAPGSDCLAKYQLLPQQYVLFLGRLSPEKNCHLLIDAFQRIETTMKLVLAGGSSHSDGYVTSLRKRSGERITFLEWISGDTLKQVLANAALFVLPSDMEGMSLSLLEAMSAGVCVLASDTPENREVVEGCGFTFRAGDVANLRQMLTVLLSDPRLREQAAAEARLRVLKHYSWDHIAGMLDSTYRTMFEHAKPGIPARVAVVKKTA